ncbi:hypothetical protein ACLMJK_001024 [Lecanora helva]
MSPFLGGTNPADNSKHLISRSSFELDNKRESEGDSWTRITSHGGGESKKSAKSEGRQSARSQQVEGRAANMPKRNVKNYPAYKDRTGMEWVTSAAAPKMKLLLNMVFNICVEFGRKALVFTDWSLIQWYAEACLVNAGFKVASIRAQHKPAERDTTVIEFNNPGSIYQVMVTSLKLSATSLNLQSSCSDVIFLDVSGNSQTLLQAGGRVLRLGQTRRVSLWVLTMDHTYDQVLQYRSTRKMITIVAGQGGVQITDADGGPLATNLPSALQAPATAATNIPQSNTGIPKGKAETNEPKSPPREEGRGKRACTTKEDSPPAPEKAKADPSTALPAPVRSGTIDRTGAKILDPRPTIRTN